MNFYNFFSLSRCYCLFRLLHAIVIDETHNSFNKMCHWDDKWRQQRKLASFEFSTRVLRDYSYAVFRRNATKLVRVVHKLLDDGRQAFDMQVTNL